MGTCMRVCIHVCVGGCRRHLILRFSTQNSESHWFPNLPLLFLQCNQALIPCHAQGPRTAISWLLWTLGTTMPLLLSWSRYLCIHLLLGGFGTQQPHPLHDFSAIFLPSSLRFLDWRLISLKEKCQQDDLLSSKKLLFSFFTLTKRYFINLSSTFWKLLFILSFSLPKINYWLASISLCAWMYISYP